MVLDNPLSNRYSIDLPRRGRGSRRKGNKSRGKEGSRGGVEGLTLYFLYF